MRVPGRARPVAASSAAMAAARACGPGSGDTLSSSHGRCVHPVMSFSINYCMTTGAGVAGYIAAWRPVSASPEAAAFARQVVNAAAPGGRDRARNLLWAAGKLAGYGIGLGLEPAPQVLLHPSVIERFTAHAPGLSGPARRTLRTNLRFIARAVVPHLDPADTPLPASGPRPRIRRRRSAATWRWRMRADLRNVRGTDIVCRSGGVIVTVRGGHAPRVVPALARYHGRLLASAEFPGGALITGGAGPPRPRTSRLRATWRADAAALIGLPAVLHAAGITCTQRIGDITAVLDPG